MQREVATLLGVTDRAVLSWQHVYEAEGACSLVHGNRGRRSPRKMPAPERQHIVSLLGTQVPNFGPTLAAEKLVEHYSIHRVRRRSGASRSRAALGAARQRGGRKAPSHRDWERRAHRGELVQFDGSYHNWFEGRGGLQERRYSSRTRSVRHRRYLLSPEKSLVVAGGLEPPNTGLTIVSASQVSAGQRHR